VGDELVDVVMLATAFLAGLSTVLSPCGYSLLPALVVYGVSGSKRAVEGVMRFALMAVGALGTLAVLTLLASLARLALIRLLPPRDAGGRSRSGGDGSGRQTPREAPGSSAG
jgi:cytochrome c biogenesis protein CcdA